MMSEALVTVVMATYQGDDMGHLQQAVYSILQQSYKHIEFIIVVDGRVDTDRLKYFDGLAKNNSVEIVYIRDNKGPAFARNLGITHAKGKYIAIMDADDLSVPDRIEHQLNFLIGHNLDLASSYLLVIDEYGNVRGKREVPTTREEIRKLAPYRCPLHNPSAFGKAEIFKRFNYDSSMRISEDYHLWVRLLINNYNLGNSMYCCVHYRQIISLINKRTGLKYARSDFKVKFLAMDMVGLVEKPLVFIIGITSALVRLLPNRMFYIVYRLRHLVLR